MKNKSYYPKKILRELDDAMEFKRLNIQSEISRRAGFNVPKPTQVQVQKYLAAEMKTANMIFNAKAWEKAVSIKPKK
jgi:hypothetical protein